MNTKCSFEFEGASNLSNWLLWKNTVKYEPIPLTLRGKLLLLASNEIQFQFLFSLVALLVARLGMKFGSRNLDPQDIKLHSVC